MRLWPAVLLVAVGACAAPECGPDAPTRETGGGVPTDLPELGRGELAVVRLTING